MPLRWTDIPHSELATKIYLRLQRTAATRSAEDSVRHILRRRLRLLRADDHSRFIELEAKDIVEHLRCTRDVYRDFVDKHECHPILEAYWVVLQFAVFPVATAILGERTVNYLRATEVRARDLTLLFGILTRSCYENSSRGFPMVRPPDPDDHSLACDEELRQVGNLVNENILLWFRDIRDDGAVGHPIGGGPFAIDDPASIHRSWSICVRDTITMVRWIKIRKKLWHDAAPWSQGLSDLFGAVQEELKYQWRELPPESRTRSQQWSQEVSTAAQMAVRQQALMSHRGRPKSKIVADRRTVIRRVAATGVEGEQYCKKLDEVGLSTPLEWQKRDGCPKRYLDAWKHPRDFAKCRQRIANEKNRATTL